MGRSDYKEEFKPSSVFLTEIDLAKDIISSGISISTHAKVAGLAEKETPLFNRRTFLIRCLLDVLESDPGEYKDSCGLSTECIYYVYFKIAQCLQIRCHYRWNDIVLFTEVLFPSSRVILRKSDDSNQSYHTNLRLSPYIDEICFNNDHDECDLTCSEVADVDAFIAFVNGCRDEVEEDLASDHPPSLLLSLNDPPNDKASRLLDEVFGSESRDEKSGDLDSKDDELSSASEGSKRGSDCSLESDTTKQICKRKGD